MFPTLIAALVLMHRGTRQCATSCVSKLAFSGLLQVHKTTDNSYHVYVYLKAIAY